MERIVITNINPLLDSHIRQSLLDDYILTETYAMVAGVDDEYFHPAKENPVEISDSKSEVDGDL